MNETPHDPNPLRAVYTDEVVERLRAAPRTDSLVYRVAVVTKTQPSGMCVPWLDVQRAAWAGYVEAARECGMFTDPYGKDLTSRLAHTDDDQFRSAMAECQAAWYLSKKLGLNVSARPRGRGASELELLVRLPDGDVLVEVKSPLRVAIADGRARTFDDSDILDRCLADASKQFAKETRNLLMLVGRMTIGIEDRSFFVKAFYAAEKWVIDRDTGESWIGYDRTGRFLKEWSDGPHHTRVGGVLFVQEQLRPTTMEDGREVHRVDQDALMMHNPNAVHPLPEETWGDCPQMVTRDGVIAWSDGYPTGGPKP